MEEREREREREREKGKLYINSKFSGESLGSQNNKVSEDRRLYIYIYIYIYYIYMSDDLLWTPTPGCTSVGRNAKTAICSMQTLDVVWKTFLERRIIGMGQGTDI